MQKQISGMNLNLAFPILLKFFLTMKFNFACPKLFATVKVHFEKQNVITLIISDLEERGDNNCLEVNTSVPAHFRI